MVLAVITYLTFTTPVLVILAQPSFLRLLKILVPISVFTATCSLTNILNREIKHLHLRFILDRIQFGSKTESIVVNAFKRTKDCKL